MGLYIIPFRQLSVKIWRYYSLFLHCEVKHLRVTLNIAIMYMCMEHQHQLNLKHCFVISTIQFWNFKIKFFEHSQFLVMSGKFISVLFLLFNFWTILNLKYIKFSYSFLHESRIKSNWKIKRVDEWSLLRLLEFLSEEKKIWNSCLIKYTRVLLAHYKVF